MKKNILSFLIITALIFSSGLISAQILSPNLFSQNGWMPDSVGLQTSSTDSANCPGLKYGFGLPCALYGSLYSYLNTVEASQARLIRYGGIAADQNNPKKYQYLKFVDSVRARGMEPILQISVNFEDASGDYDTLNAKDIITFINGTHSRNVIYWSIGNEPDQPIPSGYAYDTKEEAIKIATYTKNWSKAMRRAVPSVPIKIVGPELAEWNCNPFYTKKMMVDSLLKPNQRCDITGLDPATGKPWIDIFSFHWYCGIDGDATSLPRATVIANLRKTNGFAQTLDTLNVKLAAANSYHGRTGSTALKSAVTEANIAYQTVSSDAFSDVKCNGFFAGQHWLEISSIAAEKGVDFVNFWSSTEGSMGYMKNDGTKKSTYCHFQKIAENFSGVFYPGTDDSSGVAIKNIKAFGSKDGNHIAIVILNQDSLLSPAGERHFGINLNGVYTGITKPNKIKLSMGVNKVYQDSIDDATTMLLEFDLAGNLSQRYIYGQSATVPSDCFTQPYCSTPVTYTSQAQLDAYVPGVYSNITIGNGTSSWIAIGATNNSIYRAVNNITLKGNFKVPLGSSLSLIPTPCN